MSAAGRPRGRWLAVGVPALTLLTVSACREEQGGFGAASSAAATASSTATAIALPPFKTYTSEERFAIDYPEDWSATKLQPVVGVPGRPVEFTSSAGVASLNVSRSPLTGGSLDAHVRDIENVLLTTKPATIAERRDLSIRDMPARWLVIEMGADPSAAIARPHKVLATYVQRGQTVWRLWCRADPAPFEKYRDYCAKMVDSFRFF